MVCATIARHTAVELDQMNAGAHLHWTIVAAQDDLGGWLLVSRDRKGRQRVLAAARGGPRRFRSLDTAMRHLLDFQREMGRRGGDVVVYPDGSPFPLDGSVPE